jgi:hypothetical protein
MSELSGLCSSGGHDRVDGEVELIAGVEFHVFLVQCSAAGELWEPKATPYLSSHSRTQ